MFIQSLENLSYVLAAVRHDGYAFVADILTCRAQADLASEATSRRMENVAGTRRRNAPNKVTERFSRILVEPGSTCFEATSHFVTELVAAITGSAAATPELAGWSPTEYTYMMYRDGDGITPHRDSGGDQLMVAIVTITGSARIRILQPLGDPNDYGNLDLVEERLATPGSLMLLRTTGLGSGERVIHQVFPPENGSRLILALRQR